MLKNYYLLSLFFGSFRISYEELFTMVLSGGRAVRKDDKDLNWTCSGVGFVFMFYNQLVTERPDSRSKSCCWRSYTFLC